MDDFDNLILLTDSYKVSHHKQYPPGTSCVYSYFESRGGRFPETVFFGLQYLMKRYLQRGAPFLHNINDAKQFFESHFGRDLFHRDGWLHILKDHGGQLPLSIRAVPEGTRVPVHNALMTIENTCPHCYWLTNYVETLLVQTWYPTTIATLSNQYRQLILRYLQETGDPSLIDYKLHDFGERGSTSMESAAIGGCAHLVNFKGTDTMPALILARNYYHEPMAGFSIPAAEHSTITSWGKTREADAYRNMLTQFPEGLVAVVSDSYDIYNACSTLWGMVLKNEVLSRNGTVIIRPDSGNPCKVVPEVINRLMTAFGYETNAKGYRVLNPHVRVIQGDGIDLGTCNAILFSMRLQKQSADNIAFGSGGGLLQQVNRDTQKFAFKCSQVTVDGETHDVWKEPVTDPGKNSKRGRLKLFNDESGWMTSPANTIGNDCLVEVFRNGLILQDYTLADIRKRAMEGL